MARTAAFTSYTAPVARTTWLTAPRSVLTSTTWPCRTVRWAWRSRVRFIRSWYFRRSAWARRDQTAGPFRRFSSRYWMQHSSAALAISPPRASSSRTRWPLPVPPMAGLQGMLPTASRLMVKTMVSSPRRAAARAASMPACPAPMTAISNCPAEKVSIHFYPFFRVMTATCGRLNKRKAHLGELPRPRETNTSAPSQSSSVQW